MQVCAMSGPEGEQGLKCLAIYLDTLKLLCASKAIAREVLPAPPALDGAAAEDAAPATDTLAAAEKPALDRAAAENPRPGRGSGGVCSSTAAGGRE